MERFAYGVQRIAFGQHCAMPLPPSPYHLIYILNRFRWPAVCELVSWCSCTVATLYPTYLCRILNVVSVKTAQTTNRNCCSYYKRRMPTNSHTHTHTPRYRSGLGRNLNWKLFYRNIADPVKPVLCGPSHFIFFAIFPFFIGIWCLPHTKFAASFRMCVCRMYTLVLYTWNVFSSARTIRQQTHVLSAFGSGFIWCWLRIQWFGTWWRESIDVHKFSCFRYNRSRWFQCGSWAPTVRERERVYGERGKSLRKMAKRKCNKLIYGSQFEAKILLVWWEKRSKKQHF